MLAKTTMQFDHLGIIVSSMARGRDHLTNLFGIHQWTAEFADATNGVYVQFGLDPSGICYELISPYGEDSPVGRTLKVRDRILNHVAYLISDLDQAAARIREERCFPINEASSAIAYGGSRIQFFVSPLAFILELVEAPGHKHCYQQLKDTLSDR